MTKVRVAGFSVSIDGFGAELMQWIFPTRYFFAMQGKDGGTAGYRLPCD